MGASWDAYKASWKVLRADPELLLVPVLGLLLLAVLLPVAILAWSLGIPAMERQGWPEAALLAVLLPYAWLLTTVFVLLDALIVVSAHERIHGGAPTLAGSLRKVAPHLGRLMGWAFLLAFVTSLLAMVARRGSLPRALALAGGVSLSLATMFVVPHIVLERGPVRGALKASGRAIRDRFGPVTKRTIAFSAFGGIGFFALVFGGIAVAGGVAASAGLPDWAVATAMLAPIAAAFAFACFHGVVTSIYKTAVYDAMRGREAPWYPHDALVAPFED